MQTEMHSWCMKCNGVKPMIKLEKITMRNGKPAIKGYCKICGGTMSKFGRLVSE